MTNPYTPVEVIVNRILVVEDDRDEAEFLKTLLQQKKFEVEIARDAGQARAAFNMHLPDFVILDAILPNDVSGFEVLERMKQSDKNVPVLMLTAIDMDDARALAERIGADGYMTKPYDPDELLEQILTIAEHVWAKKHLGTEPKPKEKIRFSCLECGKHMKAKASHRGRTLNCPQCGQAVVVPHHD